MHKLQAKILDPRLGRDFPLPEYATSGSAGLDLRAMLQADTTLEPGQTLLIPTGLSIHIADPGLAALVLPRSGLAARHGIALVNAPGLIDAGYRGEVRVLLLNTDREAAFEVAPGDRIAQLVIVRHEAPELVEVDSLDETVRGDGGFGSTGR